MHINKIRVFQEAFKAATGAHSRASSIISSATLSILVYNTIIAVEINTQHKQERVS